MRATLLALAIFLGGTFTAVAQPVPGAPKSVRVFTLKNADAEKLRTIVTTIFGQQGITATVDARTNSLVVTGDADTLKEVHKLVLKLDEPAKRLAPTAAQPQPEEPAKNPALFLKAAREALKWDEPAEPARILGPIYFVGTKGLGSFLITGSEGHILLYTGMPGSGPMIEKSITKLGFKPKDVKIILTGHAHLDHTGGHAYLKKATGAKIAMMREEVELFESGGKLDFHYGDYKEFAFDPTKTDTIFRDEEEIKLGDIAIQAHLTPGHTKGSTTYVTKVAVDGKTYTVVFPDGTSVNPGYRVFKNPSYKGIADDFRKTFRTLESLKPDVWLTGHNNVYGLDAKLERAAKDGVKAWVDPEGYKKWVATQKEKFEAALDKKE